MPIANCDQELSQIATYSTLATSSGHIVTSNTSYLLKEWLQDEGALPPDVGGDADDVLVEWVPELRVLLVVEEGDHVREEDVVGARPPEEGRQSRHGVLHQHLGQAFSCEVQ